MEEFELDNCIDIQFKYEFESCLGDTEGSHYIQDIKASIVRCDEQIDEPLLIGQSKIKILLLEQAMNDDYSIYDVFDTYDYTMRIGRMIYNFDHDCIAPDLYMKLFGKKDMLNSNICIFERLEILPEYRGLGIGAKFIKDKYINFSSSCGLIVMQPFPLQLEDQQPQLMKEFDRRMNYALMEQDERKATKSLKDFYKRTGFVSVSGYKDLMFLRPGFRNRRLEAIDMSEEIIYDKDKK